MLNLYRLGVAALFIVLLIVLYWGATVILTTHLH